MKAQSLFLFIFCFWFELTKSTGTTYIGHGHSLRCDRAVTTRHVDSFSCYKSFLIAFAMRLYHWMVPNCYVFCWTTFGWLFYTELVFRVNIRRFNVLWVFSYIKVFRISSFIYFQIIGYLPWTTKRTWNVIILSFWACPSRPCFVLRKMSVAWITTRKSEGKF